MRTVPLLVATICLLYINASAAPSQPAEDSYEAEKVDHVLDSKCSSSIDESKKSKEKLKVKHLKDGTTVTTIKNKSKDKKVIKSASDDYERTDGTKISKDGSVDTISDSAKKRTRSKEVDVVKKAKVERIVTDVNGNVISDETKCKTKEKSKKKEKTKEKHKKVKTHRDAAECSDEVPKKPPSKEPCDTKEGSEVQPQC